jgi:hypothetical protein
MEILFLSDMVKKLENKMKKYNWFLILSVLILFISCGQEGEDVKGLAYDPPGATITTDKEISFQHKRTIYFSDFGIYASNEFEGARLNDFYRENDSVYTAVIDAENKPINGSPWFSLKLWAGKQQDIYLNLKYVDYNHRYIPKLSNDGINWESLDTTNITIDTSAKAAIFEVTVSTDTLWISAQELITSKYYNEWENKIAALPYVEMKSIGNSAQGKKINELLISGNEDVKDFIFIIGRQHPPEVTGFFALKAFVETVVSDKILAEEFRKNYNIIVVPLVNPDGVDNGHWRHNINGVDLNRDWIEFNQHETKAVSDEIKNIIDNGGELKFFIDFHSTQKDVFYTLSLESTITNEQGEGKNKVAEQNHKLISSWLSNLQRRLPDYNVNIIDTLSQRNSPTSDRWVQRTFNAPALTYEVGDETNRDLIKKVASTAAEELMKLMVENPGEVQIN